MFWCAAFALFLPVYLLLSVDDFRDLLFAALTASAPAMWFAPALLLLAASTTPSTAIALVLMANSTRLLVSRGVPRKLRPVEPSAPTGFQSFTKSGIFGALAFQAGMCGVWAGYPLLAAGCFVLGAAIWTRSFFARATDRRPGQTSALHAVLSLLLTLVISTVVSAGQFGREGTLSMVQRLIHPSRTVAKTSRLAVTRLAAPGKSLPAGKDGVPGVICGPTTRPARNRPHSACPAACIWRSPTLLLFRLPANIICIRHLRAACQPDSIVHRGTPLDFAYMTLSGGPVETEAYQTFDPPLDLSGCGKVMLTIASGESTPSLVTMQLLTADRMADLGSAVFGMTPDAQETLEFVVNNAPRTPVKAIRMTFERNPAERYQNTRVAIEQFTLVPRGS